MTLDITLHCVEFRPIILFFFFCDQTGGHNAGNARIASKTILTLHCIATMINVQATKGNAMSSVMLWTCLNGKAVCSVEHACSLASLYFMQYATTENIRCCHQPIQQCFQFMASYEIHVNSTIGPMLCIQTHDDRVSMCMVIMGQHCKRYRVVRQG